MGKFGLDTQGGTGNLTSTITGNLPKLTVAGDIQEASIHASGNIGSATIGGSLIGGAAGNSGDLTSSGDMGMSISADKSSAATVPRPA